MILEYPQMPEATSLHQIPNPILIFPMVSFSVAFPYCFFSVFERSTRMDSKFILALFVNLKKKKLWLHPQYMEVPRPGIES